MGDIVTAGHICVDLAPRLVAAATVEPGDLLEIGPLTMTLGGSVANTGGDLADLGLPVRLVAAISDDELGAFVRREFVRRGLDPRWLQLSASAGTSYSVILQMEQHDRTIWHHSGANAYFDAAAIDLSGADIVHFGYPPLMRGMLQDAGEPLRRFFRDARAAGATTSLDMAVVDPRSEVAQVDWPGLLANVLPEVDVFTPSIDDISSALGHEGSVSDETVDLWGTRFLDAGVAVSVLSGGERGLFVRTAGGARFSRGGAALAPLSEAWHDRSHRQPPLPLDSVVTTNGAGDAATAGLLSGLWGGLPLEQAVRSAAAGSAMKISGRRLDGSAIGRLVAGAAVSTLA